MRLVIDMQGAQSASSRHRGIGRYTLALAEAIIQNRGKHEIILALNGLFPDSADAIREKFAAMLPQENILVWHAPGPLSRMSSGNEERRRSAELIRETFLASLRPDLVLVSSLFEGPGDDTVTSIGACVNRVPTAVILYDLIPLIYRDIYLKISVAGEWYEEKLGYLRCADLLLSISESTRQEALRHLDLPPETVINVSSAANPHFRPITLGSAAIAALSTRYALQRPFVMYTGGIDHRKNIEGLIRAYASLPRALRETHQLAVVCWIEPAERALLEELGRTRGLQVGELVLTGFVPDEDLLALYNLCQCLVFPSWHEGFGLPALEAMSCGRAVIGANCSSVPEVIGRDDALFDPQDDGAIAAKLERLLSDETFRRSLEVHGLEQARRFSWDASAQKAIAAFEDWHARHPTGSGALPDNPLRTLSPEPVYLSPQGGERQHHHARAENMNWFKRLPDRLRSVGESGLNWRQRVRRIPIAGRIIAWCHAFLLLDVTRRQVALGLDELRDRQQRAEQRIARLEAFDVEDRLRRLDEMYIAQRLNRLDEMDIANRLNRLDAADIANRLNRLDEMDIASRLNRLDEMDIANRLHRLDEMDIDGRLNQIEETNVGQRLAAIDSLNLDHRMNGLEAMKVGYRLNRLDALDIANRLHVFDTTNIANRLNRLDKVASLVSSSAASDMTESSLPRFDQDAFYIDFENTFRGEHQEIKDRLAIYLPYLTKLSGDAVARIVDVGCGRGEWLELLNAQGIDAMGIDLNADMVRACQQRGLAAECTDAIGYLRSRPPASLAAVTGFHIIEHLPFATLLELFDAALQALRPGGIIMFETPNPENLAVGACNFYFDPTHRHPIVPMVAEFMARQRGFARTEILRLHPYPDDHLVHEDSEAARRINRVLYGAQDYALLAWKANAD